MLDKIFGLIAEGISEHAGTGNVAVKICLGGGTVKVGISMLSAIGRWWEHVRQNTEFPRSKTRTIRCVIPAIKAFVIALFWDIRPSAQDCETVHLRKIESEHLAVRRSIHDSNEVSAQKQHWHAVHMYDIKRVHCCLLCCSKNKWTNSSGFRQHIARNNDYGRIHHLIPERGYSIQFSKYLGSFQARFILGKLGEELNISGRGWAVC